MKKLSPRFILLAGGTILLIVGIVLLAPAHAEAAFANTGIPARCYDISFSSNFFMTCVTPQGSATSFVSSQRVPTGYYFLVTDIMVSPLGGTAGNALTDFDLEDTYSTSGIQSITHFRNLEGSTYGQHFNAPMWVLLPDHRLQVVVSSGNQQNFDIRINGFLVTNLNYLPVVISQ